MDGKFELKYENKILKVYLYGKLDASNAPNLSDDLAKYKGQDVQKIVFCAKQLEYIASAGIRVIIFAVQQILNNSGDCYFVGAQDDILSVLKMTGVDDALIIQDSIENC